MTKDCFRQVHPNHLQGLTLRFVDSHGESGRDRELQSTQRERRARVRRGDPKAWKYTQPHPWTVCAAAVAPGIWSTCRVQGLGLEVVVAAAVAAAAARMPRVRTTSMEHQVSLLAELQ
jgi:hypothetical protein